MCHDNDVIIDVKTFCRPFFAVFIAKKRNWTQKLFIFQGNSYSYTEPVLLWMAAIESHPTLKQTAKQNHHIILRCFWGCTCWGLYSNGAEMVGRWMMLTGCICNVNCMYRWSELQVWQQGALVKHVKGLFKAEGISNAAEPGNSMHTRLYVRRIMNWILLSVWAALQLYAVCSDCIRTITRTITS